jgi:hypothetical protein
LRCWLRSGSGTGTADSSAAVDRAPVQLLGRRDLDDPPEVHNGDAIGDVSYDGEVVGNEDIRQPELVPEVVEQVDNLRLNRDIHAETGSSATITLGSSASARAIPTR